MFRPLLSQMGRRASIPVSGAVAGTVQTHQAQNSVQQQVQQAPVEEGEHKLSRYEEDEGFQVLNKDDIQSATQVITNYTEFQATTSEQNRQLNESQTDMRANSQLQDLNDANRRESIRFLLKAGQQMAQNDNIRNTVLRELASDPQLRDSIMEVQNMVNNTTPQIEYDQEGQDLEQFRDMMQTDDVDVFGQMMKEQLFKICYNIHKGYVKISNFIQNLFGKLMNLMHGVGTNVRHSVSGEKEDVKEEAKMRRADIAIGVVTVVATIIISVAVIRKGPLFLAKLLTKRR